MGSKELTSSRLLNVVWVYFKGKELNEESKDSELDDCN
jgi:hypothetical protein